MTVENFISTILIFLYAQGIFLSVFMFFSKKVKRLPVYFLSLFTFIFSSAVLGKLLYFLGFFESDNQFYFLHTSLLLGMGPAIYHYFKFQLIPKPRFTPIQLLHFIPMLLECLFYIFAPIKFVLTEYAFIYSVEQSLAQFSVIFYTILSYKLINKNIRRNGSSKNTTWYKSLILLYMFGIILWIFYVVINLFIFNDQLLISDYFPLYFYAAFVVYTIAYSSLLKPLLETRPSIERKQASQQHLDLAKQIEQFMTSKKPYLNPTLRLKTFASKLSMPQNTVSEVINTVFNMTFSDYICEYRINEIKALLLTDELEIRTIESIAMDNGFNSRSSFHNSFKKLTGLTPREFIAKNTRPK